MCVNKKKPSALFRHPCIDYKKKSNFQKKLPQMNPDDPGRLKIIKYYIKHKNHEN